MSIKKEFETIIANGEGDMKINDISRLSHHTKDALGNECDSMSLTFKYIGGIKGGKTYSITSRNYDDVIEEIGQLTKAYLTECAEVLTKNLKAGYR